MKKIGLMVAMLCGLAFCGCKEEFTNSDKQRLDVAQKMARSYKGYYKDWDVDICYNVYEVPSHLYSLTLKTYVPCTEKVMAKIVNPRESRNANECQKKSEPLPAERTDQK